MKLEEVLREIDAVIFVDCDTDYAGLFQATDMGPYRRVAPNNIKAKQLAIKMQRLKLRIKRGGKSSFFVTRRQFSPILRDAGKIHYLDEFRPAKGDITIRDRDYYQRTIRLLNQRLRRGSKILVAGASFGACILDLVRFLYRRGYTTLVLEEYTDFFYSRNLQNSRQEMDIKDHLKVRGNIIDGKIQTYGALFNKQAFLCLVFTNETTFDLYEVE